MSSLKKDVSSPDVDDSDSDDDLEVEEMGPKSLAAFEGRPLLGRDIDSLEEVREMGPTSLKALAGSSEKSDLGSTVQQTDNNEDSLDLVVNMGPASMKALAAAQPNENSKKVNGKLKEGMPVPQPKPRRKPPAQEDKNLTDVHAENARLRGQKVELEQQLDRTKRDSDARAKQQEKMIGRLTAQLEEKELAAATKTSHSKDLAKKDAELKSLKDKMKSEIERKVAEKDAKRKSATASLQKEIGDLKKQLEETRRLREAEKKQLKKEADKIRGQLHKQVKADDSKTRQAEIDGLMAEIDDLKQQLQIKGAQVNDLNRLASTRGEEKDRLAGEVEKLKRELEQSRVDENTTNQVEISRLTAENSDLQKNAQTNQVEISRLTAENSDLKRQLQDKNAQIRNLNQSASHQVVERERLAKEAENLQGELLTLRQSRTDDGKTKQAEISRLTGEMRDLRGQLQAKSTRIEQLNQQANTHEDEKRELERRVEELQGNVHRLQQERNDDGRAKHVELERLNMEIGTLKGQLQIKNAQVEDLSQLASTRGEEKELLENQVKHLQEQVLKMQDIKKSLTDDNQAKIARIDELTRRLTLQDRKLEQQSREIEANRVRAGGERHDLVASTPAMNSGSRSVIDDRICPMCQKRFPEPISQQEYERHVQSHF